MVTDVLTIGVGGTVGIPTDHHVSFEEFKVTIDEIDVTSLLDGLLEIYGCFDDFSNLFNGTRKRFPIKKNGDFLSLVARPGSNINIQDNVFLFINDVLQVPGVGYEFSGGSVLELTEAPKLGDSVKVNFL